MSTSCKNEMSQSTAIATQHSMVTGLVGELTSSMSFLLAADSSASPTSSSSSRLLTLPICKQILSHNSCEHPDILWALSSADRLRLRVVRRSTGLRCHSLSCFPAVGDRQLLLHHSEPCCKQSDSPHAHQHTRLCQQRACSRPGLALSRTSRLMVVERSCSMRSSVVAMRRVSQWKAFSGSFAASMHREAASSHCSTAFRSCTRGWSSSIGNSSR